MQINKKAEKEKEKAEKEKEKAEKEREKAEEEKKKAENEKEKGISTLLQCIKKYNASQEDAVNDLMNAYGLDRENAEETVALYWQEI